VAPTKSAKAQKWPRKTRANELRSRPQSYFKIPFPEDRLFVPPEFVPLFAARGWRLEGFV